MTDSYTIIFLHVSRTLPDSIAGRKQVLTAVRTVLKNNHPAASEIDAQLAALETIETLQQQLPLKFK